MGARQRAQARGKRANGGQKGSSWAPNQAKSSTPSSRHRTLAQDWQDFSDSGSPNPRNGLFSMSQEARNTERHMTGWGPTKLREKAISFVSAGTLVPEEPVTVRQEDDTGQESDDASKEHTPEQDTPEQDTTPMEKTPEQDNAPNEYSPEQDAADPIVNATIDGNEENYAAPPILLSVEVSVAPPPLSRKDSASSQSSEEIVFCGRLNPTAKNNSEARIPTSIPIRAAGPGPKPSTMLQASSGTDSRVTPPHNRSPIRADNSQSTRPRNRPLTGRERARLRYQRDREDEEAIMRDYIANLAMDDDSDDDAGEDEDAAPHSGRGNEHHRFFDGSNEVNQKVQTASTKTATRDTVGQAIDWDSADLEDFDDLSTTDEEVIEVAQVLRHRVRPSGLQYLVTASGQETSEARWVLHGKLKSASALQEIRIFEEIRTMDIDEDTESSGTGSGSDEALDDLVDDIESEDDENARILKHTSRMTDEQIARALAKQEELGMGGDELMLFDGEFGDDDDIEHEFADDQDFIPFSAKKHLSNRGKSKRNRRQRDTFPPAEAFADALEQDPYGAFDIMDFDRPSLRPKKKGRKSDLPFEFGLEDEELAEHLRSTWSKDREKKASRRREKQEAREAALLEASERNDPAVIKAEIRQFLIQEGEVLKLAPMDSATRASVHRLAKALKLKSRSEGKEGQGIGRYPVLTKGPHTPVFTLDTIWEIDALLNTRKFFPRHGGGSYRGPNSARGTGAVKARRGGGGAISGATYMNGEVVGASAPELGADNKGRAILEKMGWTSGMGIGAVGNKGGLEAIKHVVKTTRAGLG